MILILLLLALLLFGAGFTLHALWIVAMVLVIAWLFSGLVGYGGRGRRWY